MNKTEKLYKQTCDEALRHAEKLARDAFKKDSRLTDCVLAMGSVTFATRQDILDDTNINEYPAMTEFFKFVGKWDEVLKLSGFGVWFRRDGSTLTEW